MPVRSAKFANRCSVPAHDVLWKRLSSWTQWRAFFAIKVCDEQGEEDPSFLPMTNIKICHWAQRGNLVAIQSEYVWRRDCFAIAMTRGDVVISTFTVCGFYYSGWQIFYVVSPSQPAGFTTQHDRGRGHFSPSKSRQIDEAKSAVFLYICKTNGKL